MFAVGGFDGTLRRVNPAWTQTLGWDEAELVSTPLANLFHPEDLDANLETIGKTATGDAAVSYETRLRTRDGGYRWVLASVRADRQAGELYIVAKDIDERRLAETHLRDVEADLRFRIGLEDLVTAMSTLFLGAREDELQGIVQQSLAELCEYFGLDRAYVVKTGDGGAIELFVEWWREGVDRRTTPIPELPIDAQRFWVRTIRSGQPAHVPDVVNEVPPGGEAAMTALAEQGVTSILFVPLRARETNVGFMGFEARRGKCTWSDESVALMRTVGELYVGAVERGRVERALASAAAELEQRNAELERSNRELEQFASIVSHDLKSPLQVVRGFVELLGREAESGRIASGDAQTYVGAALRGASRMDRLIDDLLAYSRAGQRPVTFVPVELDAIAADVLADSAALVSETDAVLTVGPLPTVTGDPTQLRQLLQNLVTNAIKFHRPEAPPTVHVAGRDDGARWHISVEDNGIGIEPEHRDDIFAMFTRLHHGDRPGSGIGLAICARVVTNHGGEIWAEDGDGGGTRLCFTLAKEPETAT